MARIGFIHDKLDIKFLILYFMARVAAPIDFPTLTELTVCDDGIGYFEFAEAVSDLVESGHLTLEDGLYSITEKGRENGAACESSLPYSVRMHCDENLVKVNEALRREAQVRSQVSENQDGTCTLKLDFNDETTPLLHLELLVPERKQADTMAQCFQDEPTDFYRQIIQLLTQRNGSQNS